MHNRTAPETGEQKIVTYFGRVAKAYERCQQTTPMECTLWRYGPQRAKLFCTPDEHSLTTIQSGDSSWVSGSKQFYNAVVGEVA